MQLMRASNNWATRPADQRFWDLQSLHTAMQYIREQARTVSVDAMNKLRAEVSDKNILICSSDTDRKASMTNWAFSQLCQDISAPAGYLRTLPIDLAVENINHGLQHSDVTDAKMLVHQNGSLMVRAITSRMYKRIWNADITERLLQLDSMGWKVPPAYAQNFDTTDLDARLASGELRRATAEQAALSLTIQEGDLIGPAGLYGSPDDMFVFMIDPERVIQDGSQSGLMRGFMLWNSEVGKSSFGISTFLFRGVCGNHIIWDARDVKELNLRHVGEVSEKAFAGITVELKRYAEDSATELEQKIASLRTFVLKNTSKEDVINLIFEKGILSRKRADAAWEAVQPDVDGAPYTAWGFAQGVTRISQLETNADSRVALDKAAGRVLDLGRF